MKNEIDVSLLYKKIEELKAEMKKRIIGQDDLVRSLIIALLAKWHIILEWVPGLAKTLSIETLSKTLDLHCKRIQFTPDLLPSDLIWSRIYNQQTWEFYTKKWPIFANFILADEINRAPSKVQSALLEAMQEGQITIGEDSFKLDEPFVVLATQNPIEQEWTYSLPEAQVDRFLLKVIIKYPSEDEEIQIMKSETLWDFGDIKKIINKNDLIAIQDLIKHVSVKDEIYEYVKNLVFSTRNPEKYWLWKIKDLLAYWASPRASIALIKVSKIVAFLAWRDYVIPEDIKEIAHDVLRHRLVPSFDAIAEDISADDLVDMVIDWVNTP